MSWIYHYLHARYSFKCNINVYKCHKCHNSWHECHNLHGPFIDIIDDLPIKDGDFLYKWSKNGEKMPGMTGWATRARWLLLEASRWAMVSHGEPWWAWIFRENRSGTNMISILKIGKYSWNMYEWTWYLRNMKELYGKYFWVNMKNSWINSFYVVEFICLNYAIGYWDVWHREFTMILRDFTKKYSGWSVDGQWMVAKSCTSWQTLADYETL